MSRGPASRLLSCLSSVHRKSGHVVALANFAGELLQRPPDGVENSVAVTLTTFAEMLQEFFRPELFIVCPKTSVIPSV